MNSEKLKGLKRSAWLRFRSFAGYFVVGFSLLTFNFSLFTQASAQDDPVEAPPPPLKIISKEDSARLETKKDIKDRTKLSIEMMNLRLAAAEKLAAARNFEGMYRELGFFHALMDDALTFLNRRDNGGGKVLDNFKRMSIALRGMATRIEVIRREIPLRYDPYIRKLMGYLRSARFEATDSLFGDSVIPAKKPGHPNL